mgnify:CR=1 FL=1
MRILKEKIITNVEAMEILDKEKDLKFFQKQTLDHLKKFYSNLKSGEINKLKEELSSLGFLREEHIVSIINTMPLDKEDLFAALGKDMKKFTEEELNKIYEIVKKYF